MSKRPDLSQIKQAAGSKPAQSATEAPTATKTTSRGGDSAGSYSPPSRANLVAVSAHFPPEVRKQLKAIAVEHDKTVQQLLGEALNHLFVAYGQPEIAPTERAGE